MGAACGAAGGMPAGEGCHGGVPAGEMPPASGEERPSTDGASRLRQRCRAQGAGRSAALARLAQAVRLLPDFAKLLPSDYRQHYGAWRAGSAVGAKGETGAAAAASTEKLPRQAWVQEISSIANVSWTQRV